MYTDHVEPLPDGRALVSIWNTAQHALVDYYLRILREDGDTDVVIRSVERRARVAFNERLNLIVVIGDTTSQLFDLTGVQIVSADHPPRSKSAFRRLRLEGIWKSLGAVFLAAPAIRRILS